MQRIFVIIIIFLAKSSFSQVAVYSNDYLNIGVGARSLAMSSSVSASETGAEASYWNPSQLVHSEYKYQTAAMHAEYFAGLADYDYLGASYKTGDSSALAFSIIRFGVDNIQNTLELIDDNGNVDYSRIKLFSVADYAFLFSFAKHTKIPGLSLGGNMKIIYRHQGSFADAYGFGIDAGMNYKKGKFSFGAMLRDASSTFNAWFFNTEELEDVFIATGNEIPENSVEITLPKLLVGTGYSFNITKDIGMLTEAGLDFTFGAKQNSLIKSNFANIDPHLGIEADYMKLIYVRAGVGNFAIIPDFDNDRLNFQPTIGLGVRLYNFKLDYALTDLGDQSVAPYSNIFSLSYSFNSFKSNTVEE